MRWSVAGLQHYSAYEGRFPSTNPENFQDLDEFNTTEAQAQQPHIVARARAAWSETEHYDPIRTGNATGPNGKIDNAVAPARGAHGCAPSKQGRTKKGALFSSFSPPEALMETAC
jgi:hypothetical protein